MELTQLPTPKAMTTEEDALITARIEAQIRKSEAYQAKASCVL